jgi:uncharacterized protein (DUF2336 family)
LAICLAPIPNAPPKTIRALAFDSAIEVAGSVLSQSERLSDSTLVEIAEVKEQAHLLAISQRRFLSHTVTDALLRRGDEHVTLSVARNNGAKISVTGFGILFRRSEADERLATSFGSRPDIPPQLLLRLLEKASDSVRARLEAAHPHFKPEINQAVADATSGIRAKILGESFDYAAADKLVGELVQSGQLDDAKLAEFAQTGLFAETTMALARMCEVPLPVVERAMVAQQPESILVFARVIGLSWSTVKAILLLRAGKRVVTPRDLEQCLASYERLKPAIALEIVQFHKSHIQPQPSKRAQ